MGHKDPPERLQKEVSCLWPTAPGWENRLLEKKKKKIRKKMKCMGINLRKSSLWLISQLICKRKRIFLKVHLALQVDFYFLESARTHHQGNSANISQNLAPKA